MSPSRDFNISTFPKLIILKLSKNVEFVSLQFSPNLKMGPAEAENSSKLPKIFGKNIRFSITKSPFFFLKII